MTSDRSGPDARGTCLARPGGELARVSLGASCRQISCGSSPHAKVSISPLALCIDRLAIRTNTAVHPGRRRHARHVGSRDGCCAT